MQPPDTVYVIYIVTSPEQAWTALTHSEFSEQYFLGRRIESSWKVGSPWTLMLEDGSLDVQGKVLECDPPRRLSLTWRSLSYEDSRDLPESIVTYEIDLLGKVVRLTMTEAHPTPMDEKHLEAGRRGWPVILSGLKTLLETGHPLPAFDPFAGA